MNKLILGLAAAGALITAAVFTQPWTHTGVLAADVVAGFRPRTTVVLVDKSASINPIDRELYLTSLRAIGKGLGGGDRLLVAPVGNGGRAAFRSDFDVTVKSTGVRLDQDEAIADARKKLDAALGSLLPAKGSGRGEMQTRLLATIAAASQAFGPAPHQNAELVLLSDGVEESPVADLSRGTWKRAEIDKTLDRADKEGLLPDLHGVKLDVIGAGGSDYQGVETFWKAYSARTGAQVRAYGRLPWQPE